MDYSQKLKLLPLKAALSTSVSVAIAFIINHYFSFSREYWILLTALLVNQTTRGTPVRQGMIIFMTAFAAIDIASFLMINIKRPEIMYVILSLTFLINGYFVFTSRPQSNRIYFFAGCFFIVLLLATLSPIQTNEFMRYRVLDAIIGATIGILTGLIIFPVKFASEFSAGIVPIVHSLSEYSEALQKHFISHDYALVSKQKNKIEVMLQSQQGMYPEWVYEIGFNRGLRSGFRFFLINLERVIDVHFSIHYLLSRHIDILGEINDAIIKCLQKNHELFAILTYYFQKNTFLDVQSDFTDDIIQLEKTLNHFIPNNLELLAVTQNNLLLTALVRDIRDLRGLLLKLVKALPASQIKKAS
jgi:hypothetical protein